VFIKPGFKTVCAFWKRFESIYWNNFFKFDSGFKYHQWSRDRFREDLEQHGREYAIANLKRFHGPFEPTPKATAERMLSYEFSSYLRQRAGGTLWLVGPNEPVEVIFERIFLSFPTKYLPYFIDPVYFTIDAQRFFEVNAAISVVADLDRLFVGKSLIAESKRLIEIEPLARTLIPYQGWSLCIVEGQLPSNDEITARLSAPEFGKLDIPDETTGRPRKQEIALEAYNSRFPDGHEGYGWKTVCQILQVECGISVSTDTLRRALKADNAQ